MVRLATSKYKKMICSNIESGLIPSYTINTLNIIEYKYPENKFIIIMGMDTLSTLNNWKDYKIIINKYDILVYPRFGKFLNPFLEYEYKNKIFFLEGPIIDISSSYIRKYIRYGKNIQPLLPPEVCKYMKKHRLYKK